MTAGRSSHTDGGLYKFDYVTGDWHRDYTSNITDAGYALFYEDSYGNLWAMGADNEYDPDKGEGPNARLQKYNFNTGR